MSWFREAEFSAWLLDSVCGKKETKVSETKADISSCDFIRSLTAQQKAELRKLLDEDAKENTPWTVDSDVYENGRLAWIEEWRNGKQHGKAISWHTNGNKVEETDYIDGLKNGKHIKWDDKGNKLSEDEYRSDVLVKH